MSEDGTATLTPLNKYRLKTHELAPLLVPKARAASTSSADTTERKGIAKVTPATGRLRGSIVRESPRRFRLESVAFDPFSDSESFRLLLQDPKTSSARREDSRAVSTFKEWMSLSFPQLLCTFRALGMTKAASAFQEEPFIQPLVDNHNPSINSCSSPIDETEEEGEGEREIDCDECWRLMLRYATVLSAIPNETIALQSITPTKSVYFLLSGVCQLSFRPMLLRDDKPLSSLPAIALSCSVHPVIHLQELSAGDCFGLDTAAFEFEYHLSTATAGSARQRNVLGLREEALTYVLCLPYTVVLQLQHHNKTECLSPTFPYSFATEAELFLRNTFLFSTMTDASRRFLAAQLQHIVVAKQEYLFTPGQPVRVFIVISGQLTLGAPREERTGNREAVDLELELLQTHDSVGIAEALHLTATFDRYCVVTSTNGARAYALPWTVLLLVLAQESASLALIQEWILQRKSWFELRRATAMAQCKKLVVQDSHSTVKLTIAAQRGSKLTCSRCGWTGHVSTSSSCVRVNNHINNSNDGPSSLLDIKGRSRRDSRAARQQARKSHSPRHSETTEAIPVSQPFPPVRPTSSRRTSVHRRLQVDSMALRALRISKLCVADPPTPEPQKEQLTTSQTANTKEDTVRSCALAQSRQRLEAALQHKNTLPVTSREKMNGKILHISS